MLILNSINKHYGKFSLRDVSFEVNSGDYFIILGPSGAGKSVVLEIIAGLVRQESGQIILDGFNISSLSIQERKVGLVFQDLALFPHMSVRQNIAYPLKRQGFKSTLINRKVLELANAFSITHLLKRNPSTLSGGEQQRVALARTLATDPKVLLLDEPLSSLDVELKSEVRRILRNLNRNGQTIIHVTHDYEEAIALGNRIAVMNNGAIEQMGTPEEIFTKPASSFVASFGGVRNFFPAEIIPTLDNDLAAAKVGKGLQVYLYSDTNGLGYISFPESSVTISELPLSTSALNTFKGEITDIYPQRHGFEVVVNIGISVFVSLTRESLANLNLKIGKEVWVSFKASSVRFIPREK